MSQTEEMVYEVPPELTQQVLKVLSNATRYEILMMLRASPMNISDLARKMALTQPTVTLYVRQLELAGLVFSKLQKSANGLNKVCYAPYSGISIDWNNPPTKTRQSSYELDMPVGHYSAIDCAPPSLLASQAGIIATSNDFSRFFHPIRMEAELLQIGQGKVSYLFPYNIPRTHNLLCLELSAEISVTSIQPATASHFSVSINQCSLGPFGLHSDGLPDTRRLPFAWYPRELPICGDLYAWGVDSRGSFMNGIQIGDMKLENMRLQPLQPIEVVFEVAPNAQEPMGMILFGKSFGRHHQDIRLTLVYEPEEES